MQQKPLTHVFVTVPEGRLVPVPASEMSTSGPLEPGKVYVRPWTSYTRRRLVAGDLVLSNQGGTKVDAPEDARAPEDFKLDTDGTLADDQRSDDAINAEASTKAAADDAAKTKAAELEARRNRATPATAGKDQ